MSNAPSYQVFIYNAAGELVPFAYAAPIIPPIDPPPIDPPTTGLGVQALGTSPLGG